MQPDDRDGRAAYEVELARRIRNAVVTEVPRRPVRAWLLAGVVVVAAAALLVLLIR